MPARGIAFSQNRSPPQALTNTRFHQNTKPAQDDSKPIKEASDALEMVYADDNGRRLPQIAVRTTRVGKNEGDPTADVEAPALDRPSQN